MLRSRADIVSLVYMVAMPVFLYLNWSSLSFNIFYFLGSMSMAAGCFAITHNHKHLPMWESDFMNKITDYWLVLFYGYPVFVWIPTHNANHHKYVNKEGDYTITYRVTRANNLLTLVAYPFISSYFQSKPITDYLKKLWSGNRKKFFYCASQYVWLIAYLSTFFYLDYQKALLYVLIPQLFSLVFVLMINYIQHVHANEDSEYNHSRNFTGLGNRFLLNNGLHTAHHENMSLHWSKLSRLHRQIEDRISPVLIERSLLWYIIRTYFLSILIPRYRSKQAV